MVYGFTQDKKIELLASNIKNFSSQFSTIKKGNMLRSRILICLTGCNGRVTLQNKSNNRRLKNNTAY